jgi:hypothetical protein
MNAWIWWGAVLFLFALGLALRIFAPQLGGGVVEVNGHGANAEKAWRDAEERLWLTVRHEEDRLRASVEMQQCRAVEELREEAWRRASEAVREWYAQYERWRKAEELHQLVYSRLLESFLNTGERIDIAKEKAYAIASVVVRAIYGDVRPPPPPPAINWSAIASIRCGG